MQRRSFVRKFLSGLTDADYADQRLNKNENELTTMSWRAMMNAFAEVDTQIGPQAKRIYRPSQAVRQTREVDMEVPQILPDPRQPAGSAKPPLQPARPHQVPASWGQGTASMPTAPMPMSVDEIGEAGEVRLTPSCP